MKFTHGEIKRKNAGFCAGAFAAPPTGLYPAYSWGWNGPLTKEEIRRQLDECHSKNIKVIYALPEPKNFRPHTSPTYMEPDYLTEEWFAMFRYMVEYAVGLGMEIWLYDEGGWPSGSACGRVVAEKPFLGRRKVMARETASPYVPGENALAAFADGKRIAPGAEAETPITEYYTETMTEASIYEPAYPNLLEAETAETFIETTHEGYKKYVGDFFGKEITACFTDEPAVSGIPWSRDMEARFSARYGYDVLDVLPAITAPMEETLDEKGTKARRDFRNLVAEMFAENYFQKLRKWCRENNLLSTGHVGGDDETLNCVHHGFHHILRQLRQLDIPGIDVIWRQIFPGKETNHFFPRFAGSAANQIGAENTVSESYSIYGAGLTFDQMRHIMMYQMVRGISMINIMVRSYLTSGRFIIGSRPGFIPEMPKWEHLGEYHTYMARMSYLMSLGKWGSDCALYMPMCDFWGGGRDMLRARDSFDGTARTLEKNHCAFDIIDDDFLETAEYRDGCLCTGTAAYHTVVVPDASAMPEASKKVLEAFRAKGGTVLSAGEAAKAEKAAEISTDAVAVGKRILPEGALYLVYNESTEPVKADFSFKETGNMYELDAWWGKIYEAETKNVSLQPGEERVFLITDKTYPAEKRKTYTEGKIEISDFMIKRERAFVIGKDRFESHTITEEYRPCGPVCWEELFAKDFSGVATYKVTFTAEKWEKISIDLGHVLNSCSASLNGVPLGTRCFAPYVFEADGAILKEENELLIRVANTAANQFVETKVYDDWEVVGPYHEKQKAFERDSAESGILSSITISY